MGGKDEGEGGEGGGKRAEERRGVWGQGAKMGQGWWEGLVVGWGGGRVGRVGRVVRGWGLGGAGAGWWVGRGGGGVWGSGLVGAWVGWVGRRVVGSWVCGRVCGGWGWEES